MFVSAASYALGKRFAKAAPALAEQVLEPLIAAAKDSDILRFVLLPATPSAEVAKAAPALAEKVLEPLIAAAKDSDSYVRSAARSALGRGSQGRPSAGRESPRAPYSRCQG